MRRVLVYAALCAALLPVSAEMFLRHKGYPFPHPRVPHPVYHHTLLPNATGRLVWPGSFSVEIRTNNLGMRDKARSLAKSADTYRVLVLGDSFVQGYGLQAEHLFTAVAEQRLNKNPAGDRRLEVLNAGFVSYSPLLEYLYYREFARRLKPDLVVQFLDWSDIQDDTRYLRSAQATEQGYVRAVPGEISESGRPMGPAEYCALLNWWHWENPPYLLKRKACELALKPFVSPERRQELLNPYPHNPNLRLGEFEQDRYMLLRDEYVPIILRNVQLTQTFIHKLAREVRKDGADFLLVLYPLAVQVSGKEWGIGRTYWGFDPGKVYGDEIPFALFEDFAQRYDIRLLNLLPHFRASKDFPLFYPIDGHWTKAGHALVAGVLADQIEAIADR